MLFKTYGTCVYMMTNTEIVLKLKAKTQEESKLLVEILNLLELVRNRHIYTEYGFSSLFEFCLKELKYSEGAAMRRINALRLQSQSPELKKMIHENLANRQLNLSQIGAVAKIERSDDLSVAQIKQALVASQGTSARETENVIRKKLDLKPLKINTKICVELNTEQLAQAEKLAAQFSHAIPTRDLSGLFLLLLEREIAREKKSRAKASNETQSPPTSAVKTPTVGNVDAILQQSLIPSKIDPAHQSIESGHSRPFSAMIRKKVLKRSQSRCEFVSPITQKRCESSWYLQLDHIQPWSLGGASTLENCRAVCGSHNRSEWRRVSTAHVGTPSGATSTGEDISKPDSILTF